MVKTAIVYSRIPIKSKWIKEVQSLIPIDIKVVSTKEQLSFYYNDTAKSAYADFYSLRSIIKEKADIRAFYMSLSELREMGVTNHQARYDSIDNDSVIDFYVGIEPRLDFRAKYNGFKSNFAWEFVHELLHAFEQQEGNTYPLKDRTHDMEVKGELKKLLKEHVVTLPGLKSSLLDVSQKLLALLSFMPPTTLLHPVPKQYRKVTQAYGVPNNAYPATKHHNGTDYATPLGTALFAPWNGEMIEVDVSAVLGNYGVYKFNFIDKTYEMRVLHLENKPIKGAYKRGDIIGYSGKTGQSTGPHTHLDVWNNKVNLIGITADNFRQRTVDPELLFNTTI